MTLLQRSVTNLTEAPSSSAESSNSESEDLCPAEQQSTKCKANAGTKAAGRDSDGADDHGAGEVSERAAIFDAKVVCSFCSI